MVIDERIGDIFLGRPVGLSEEECFDSTIAIFLNFIDELQLSQRGDAPMGIMIENEIFGVGVIPVLVSLNILSVYQFRFSNPIIIFPVVYGMICGYSIVTIAVGSIIVTTIRILCTDYEVVIGKKFIAMPI